MLSRGRSASSVDRPREFGAIVFPYVDSPSDSGWTNRLAQGRAPKGSRKQNDFAMECALCPLFRLFSPSTLFLLASPPTKLLNRFQRDFAMARPVGVGIESISLIATSPP